MFSSVKQLLDKRVNYLVYWVTQNCNAKCAFCFNYEENTKKNNDLTLDELETFTRKLGKLQYLTLAGGEPSLRKDLGQVAGLFAKNCDLDFCNIVTNGFRWKEMLGVAEHVCSNFPSMTLQIGISIDYIGHAHDEHRVLKGTFSGCMHLIEGLKELMKTYPNLVVGVGGTLTTDNADTIVKTAKWIMDTYAVPYSITLIRGDVQDMSLKGLSPARYREIAHEILDYQQKYLPQVGALSTARYALEEMSLDNIYHSFLTGEETVPCRAGEKALIMEASGNLRGCEMLDDSFGNIRDFEYDVYAMLEQQVAKDFVARIRREKCNCTWECFNRANIAYDVKAWPRVGALTAKRMLSR